MKHRFNEDGQFIGNEYRETCTKCKKEFIRFRDWFKCAWIVEKPCECGENKVKKK